MNRVFGLVIVLSVCLCSTGLRGQDTASPQPEPGMIALNFPENLELKALIDYVGQRRGINFIYDQSIVNKRVTIKAPKSIPADSLMTLLDSTLKMNGLAMTETEVEGMLRIDTAKASLLADSVGPHAGADAMPAARPTLAVTRVFELEHGKPSEVNAVVAPFLSSTTAANVTPLDEHRLLIITDYATNMKRIESMISLIDRPKREVRIKFVSVIHLDANELVEQANTLLKSKNQAPTLPAAKAAGGARLAAIERTNQVAIIGTDSEVAEAGKLVASLDVPLGLETKVYAFKVVSPEQVDRLVNELIGEGAAKRLYKSAVDTQSNLLIATTTPQTHEQIESLRRSLDKPLEDSQSPIRFYKLENAKATDVLLTLQNIEGDTGLTDVTIDGVSTEQEPSEPAELPITGPTEDEVNNRRAPGAFGDEVLAGLSGDVVELRNARVLADEPTNTIIVVAQPSMHPIYEKLIKRLDVRRPQVLVEATVVAIDTSDGFSLGVEFNSREGADGGTLFNFTQFGLSTRDPSTGELTLVPGLGFTGALLDADIAEVIIRALETDVRAKVVSRPSVLINDNATGQLESASEEPFESVNANAQVATTSFGGFASAGTNIIVTPQISEGDYLRLEYDITLSSFGDDGTDSLPPSRQTNRLTSEATIPDGHTIVVGGLTRENFMESVDRVPILGSIPVLDLAFSNRKKNRSQVTLFVFIRAVVLRDDKFKDLKILSGDAAALAGLAGDYPISQPLVIE